MTMMTGAVALVTGASAGIGRAAAMRLAAEGARVVVSDVAEAGGKETAAMIAAAGGDAAFVRADVARGGDVEALVAATVERFGRLDCAVNNAGVLSALRPLAEQDEAEWDRVMDINAKGVFLCLKAQIPRMVQGGGGRIVNVASIAGLVGYPHGGPYVASKHAVVGLTRNAALEYARQGIRVNAICPGGVDTPMLDAAAAAMSGGAKTSHEVMDAAHPIGRIGTPEEVAELILWLCSDRCGFLTGAIIPVDGGMTAQ